MMADILTSARHARILRLLDLEGKLILKGPLAGLRTLVEQREAAVADLLASESDAPEAFLAALNARAERNSRLLLASLAGARAGAAAIGQIRTARERLRTYTPAGTAQDVLPGRVTRDQRA